jgi:hypothetical protein
MTVPHPDRTQAVLDRVVNGTYTDTDLRWLQNAISVTGDQNMVQVGRYNIPLLHGHNIHVGDRIYQGANADAIRNVLSRFVPAMPVSFGRDGPNVSKGSLRSFGGFVFTVGALGLIGGVALFLVSFVPMMKNPDAYSTGPSDEMITGFVTAGIGMVTTWIGILIRGWERHR